MTLILIIEGFGIQSLGSRTSLSSIYETIKIILESVFKDNSRLDIDTVLNFWPYTVLHRGGNDLVR